jgi:hypothetical protein
MCGIFYKASSEFNQYFTYLMGKNFNRKIRAITVEIDYDRADD